MVEPLGNEEIIHIQLNEQTINVSSTEGSQTAGTEIWLNFEKIFLFDKDGLLI